MRCEFEGCFQKRSSLECVPEQSGLRMFRNMSIVKINERNICCKSAITMSEYRDASRVESSSVVEACCVVKLKQK